jgi:hypothetical protein
VDRGGLVIGAAGVEHYGEGGSSARWLCPAAGALPALEYLHGESNFMGESAGHESLVPPTDYLPRFGFVKIDRAEAPFSVTQSHEWQAACPVNAVAMRLLI